MKRQPQQHTTPAVLDVAGAFRGGAARLLRELDASINNGSIPCPTIIGRERRLTPLWLAQRNTYVPSNQRSIALNNATFLRGSPRIVLLRNILHFATQQELAKLHFTPSRELRLQTPVIRSLLNAADVVVCPCSAMANRVSDFAPKMRGRIHVRFHPVSPIDTTYPDNHNAEDAQQAPFILVPIINSAYKHLDRHVAELVAALDATGSSMKVLVTGARSDYRGFVANSPRVNFLGVLPSAQLDRYWKAAQCGFFPLSMEAFGYPLAEARVHGKPVLSPDTEQSREIAGDSLIPYIPSERNSLTEAVRHISEHKGLPDPSPFDPTSYFEWLFNEVP